MQKAKRSVPLEVIPQMGRSPQKILRARADWANMVKWPRTEEENGIRTKKFELLINRDILEQVTTKTKYCRKTKRQISHTLKFLNKYLNVSPAKVPSKTPFLHRALPRSSCASPARCSQNTHFQNSSLFSSESSYVTKRPTGGSEPFFKV